MSWTRLVFTDVKRDNSGVFWVADPLTTASGEALVTIGTTRHYTFYRIDGLFVPPPPPKDTSAACRLEGSRVGTWMGLQWVAKRGGGWPRRLGLEAPLTPMESVQLYE